MVVAVVVLVLLAEVEPLQPPLVVLASAIPTLELQHIMVVAVVVELFPLVALVPVVLVVADEVVTMTGATTLLRERLIQVAVVVGVAQTD
jgi:hypothetical protein